MQEQQQQEKERQHLEYNAQVHHTVPIIRETAARHQPHQVVLFWAALIVCNGAL